jgi:selenocysteine lyase/cysteine desulfurase
MTCSGYLLPHNQNKQYMQVHPTTSLEHFFSAFARNIIGDRQVFDSPFGKKEIIYADWTATGRAYRPIEEYIQKEILPFLANTHTGSTITGQLMSKAYEEAKSIVKAHVNASIDDILIFCGSGMTGAVNKLQRILGWRVPERLGDFCSHRLRIDEELRPVVFVTHMEHHSNQVSWLETIATVEIIRADENGNVDLASFRSVLQQFRHRKTKIAAVTACSNVTGIQTPYHQIAKLIHEYEGLCFVDFSGSAPYTDIDMHPGEKGAQLDAIYFSPHKFLGGGGTPGVLLFDKKVDNNNIPDQPGGGTVVYSNPWKEHEYVKDIEQREDGGTPPFLGAIKVAMCIRLKERMGVENMLKREEEMLPLIFNRFSKMENVVLLEGGNKKRLGVFSFTITGLHYNLAVKMLNDRFGIQTRGGCSCAGTYGHLLLHVDQSRSNAILHSIRSGDLHCKPGWIRMSVHPTMTDTEIAYMMDAIESTAFHYPQWEQEYSYDPGSNEYAFKGSKSAEQDTVEDWFTLTTHRPR